MALIASVFLLCTLLFTSGTRHALYDFLYVKVVEIPLNGDYEIRPDIAQGPYGHSETFIHMMNRLQPYAAINGTFYDHRPKPLGDIVISGKVVNHGHLKSAIALTAGGKATIVHHDEGGFDWTGFKSGLAAGPRLVQDGKLCLDPNADGFHKASLSLRGWRSGIGITRENKLLLVTVKRPLTLKEFARTMIDLGAVDAINLDGGGACGLYHDGSFLVVPSLPMTNVLSVYRKKPGKAGSR